MAGAPITVALTGGVAVFDSTNTPALLTPAVGNHALVANFAAQNGFAASTATGTLVVNPAALAVTASSATIAYGTPVPTITPSYSGFVGTDNVANSVTTPATCSVTVPAGNPVGTYTTQCSGAVAPNYTIAYVPGTLSITAVPLTITANNVSRAFGASESDVHSKLRNPGERGYAGFADGHAVLHDDRDCHEPAGAIPDHLLGTDLDQLQHHLRAGNVDGHGGRAGAHTEPDCVGLYLAFGCNHGLASGHCLQHGQCGAAHHWHHTRGSQSGQRFGMTQNCPIGGTGLAVGGSCTINVTFTPNNTLNRSALDSRECRCACCLGDGDSHWHDGSPDYQRFADVAGFRERADQHDQRSRRPINVSNTSALPLVISSITLGGANPGRFAQTTTCPIGGAGLACKLELHDQRNLPPESQSGSLGNSVDSEQLGYESCDGHFDRHGNLRAGRADGDRPAKRKTMLPANISRAASFFPCAAYLRLPPRWNPAVS